MTLDGELHKLTMVGSVPRGGRLGHDLQGNLFVAREGLLTAAWRLVRREGRDKTLTTIRSVLMSAEERLVDMANSRFVTTSNCDTETQELLRRVQMLHTALQHCACGIANLKVTYVTDASAQAGLDLVAQKAEGVIAKAKNLLDVLCQY